MELTKMAVNYDFWIAYVWYFPWDNPEGLGRQILLLLVVWAHLVIGLHFWWRIKAHYSRYLPFVFAVAVLLPVLALLGFIRTGMNVSVESPKALDEYTELVWPDKNTTQFIADLEPVTLWTFLILVWNRFRKSNLIGGSQPQGH